MTLKRDRVEPLDLQIACARLWASLPHDVEVITHEYLQAFGDPGQAAADFYDAAIVDVQDRTHEPEADLRNWLETTFITEWGTRGTALRGITTTAGMRNNIADTFAELRILTPEYRHLSTWYQLGQDRLIDAVQRANREWREEHSISVTEPQSVQTPADYRAAAEAALSSGDFDEAKRLIAIAVEGYRQTKDTRGLAYTFELQGEIARVKGNLVAAEQSIRSALYEFAALEDTSAQVRLLSALGDAYSAVGDYTKAAQFHRQASEQLPADVGALTGLGYAQWHLGSPADAEATFTRALSWNRNESRALAGRGQVRVELREYPAALADLNRALGLGLALDSEIDARSALAVILADLGKSEEADRELRAARFQDPERPRTRLRAGRVDVALGRLEQARDELEGALQAHPPLPPIDENVARKLLAELRQGT
jgi:tetratricopeptide (TPR) repeat protein